MDYTIEGYDVRIEVREDGLVQLDVSYFDHNYVGQSITEVTESLEGALEIIRTAIEMKLAGAF